jgi:lambda family phage portal protein
MSYFSNIFSKIAGTENAVKKAVLEFAHKVRIKARFDAAQTNADNRRHWANADGLSANAAASPLVRATLRNRCRYEYENNGYVKGMLKTHANFTIGTGPRLQMLTDDTKLNRRIESGFMAWAKKVRLAKKLRVMRVSKAASGEAFAMFTTNQKLKHPVKLDLKLIEADRVRSDLKNPIDPLEIDGIRFDEDGNPITYNVMRAHPGDNHVAQDWLKSDPVPAEKMIHLFDMDRPEQSRGLPEITTTLPIFAQLRRFTLAVIAAAETAADHAAIAHTTAPPDGVAADVEPTATQEIEQRQISFLPEGWTLSQMKAEQPTTTYGDFKGELLNEAARPLNMPYNIAAGNSSKYNYASGRLDHQVYFKSIEVEQDDIEVECLDRVFEEWISEAALVEGYLPQAARKAGVEFPHQWFWDGVDHVDPVKDSTAQETQLRNHTTTLAAEYARKGKNWETELAQRAKELDRMRELNVPFERPEIIETVSGKLDKATEGAVDEK